MTETAVTTRPDYSIVEQVVIQGDLKALTPQQRAEYYMRTCTSLALNPLTRPFEYLELNGKLVLYARRDCTDQIRRTQQVSTAILGREIVDDIYVVTTEASTPDGRKDTSIGAVPLVREDGEWKTAQSGKRYFQGNGNWLPLRGDDRANAMMKAETKSKRRATLSLIGLGFLDESEIETIANARPVTVTETGEIVDPPKETDNPALPQPRMMTDDDWQKLSATFEHNGLPGQLYGYLEMVAKAEGWSFNAVRLAYQAMRDKHAADADGTVAYWDTRAKEAVAAREVRDFDEQQPGQGHLV